MIIKKVLTISSFILLVILGAAAIYGGLSLMIDPSGSSLKLPADLINDLPFENYLIPGIILFIMNGLLSLVIAVLTFLKVKKYGWLIIFQGCVLAVWLTVELIMGIFDPLLHYSCYTIAALLIIVGVLTVKLKLSLIQIS